MLLSEAIEALAIATIADGRSQRTVGDYRQKLGALLAFLGDVPIDQIAAADLRRWIAELRTRGRRWLEHPHRPPTEGGLSQASVAGYVRAAKRLFSFLHEEELLAANPARRIKGSKPKRGEPKGISREDLRLLLRATAGDEPNQIRNHALITFLADTGCRVGGLVGLRLADVDLEARTALVIEKGEKPRRLFFSDTTRIALHRWLAVRPEASTDHLWIKLGDRGPGEVITTQAVREVLRRLKASAGVTGPCNPHAFRHGFAREYLLSGGDMGTLADILGHADIATTWQSYAIFRTAELAEKHAKHSPIARLARETPNDQGDQQP
jgi:site-specific recombinase XerD